MKSRRWHEAVRSKADARAYAERLVALVQSNKSYSAMMAALLTLQRKFTAYRDAPMTTGNKVEIATIRKTLNVVVCEIDRLIAIVQEPT